MTNQEIFEILARFEGSSLTTMKLQRGDFTLELSRAIPAGEPRKAPVAAPVELQEAPAIASPLAGVFYAASEPGAKPYVSVGDKVRKGDTVCLMEAMKMISEIPAPCDCIITEILKNNGELAAYDEPLMRYQPC